VGDRGRLVNNCIQSRSKIKGETVGRVPLQKPETNTCNLKGFSQGGKKGEKLSQFSRWGRKREIWGGGWMRVTSTGISTKTQKPNTPEEGKYIYI